MKFLHAMIRVQSLEKSMDFYCGKLGLIETHRFDVPEGRFTLVFLSAAEDVKKSHLSAAYRGECAPLIELTYNWDEQVYESGRNFGHIAFQTANIYEKCHSLVDAGITINRPPRDGKMAFIKSPDGISIELLQEGDPLPLEEPWESMKNKGSW